MKASFYTESVLYWFARGLSAGAQRLPARWNVAFGAAAGTLIYRLFSHRRAVALSNLRAAFGDFYSPEEYQRILKQLFQNLGMQLMEVAAIPAVDKRYVDKWITVAPGSRERLERELAKGKGVIFLTGHFGNWEFVPITGVMHGFPTLVLAREQGWPKLNRLLTSYRESKGCKIITKGFPVREIIRGLQEGKIVGIVADQDAGRNGVLAPFFGRLASTAQGAMVLSLNSGAPVLPVFIVRDKGPAHTLRVEEPIVIPQADSEEERVRLGVAEFLKVLEGTIRRIPGQWLWLHRRWKTSPQRRVLIFSDGKPGHVNQSKAFAEKIEQAWAVKTADDKRLKGMQPGPLVGVETREIAYRSRFHRFFLAAMAVFVPKKYPKGDFWLRVCLTPESYRSICSLHADIGVSCGAATAPVNLFWSWGIGAKAIHITRSIWPSWRRFHLSVIPRHDRPPGGDISNLLVIDGALAPGGPDQAEKAVQWRRKIGLSKRKRIGFLLGGPAKGMVLNAEDVKKTVEGLLYAAKQLDAEIIVTTSRRTSTELEELVEKALRGEERCRLLVLVNRNDPDKLESTAEAVPCILRLAQVLVVSGDSISMVSEAMASSKKVVSFLPVKNGWAWGTLKHERFLKQLNSSGRLVLAEPAEMGQRIIAAMDVDGVNGEKEQGREAVGMGREELDPVTEKLVKWL